MITDSQTNYGSWSVKLRSQAGRGEDGKPLPAAPQEILDLFAVTDGGDNLLGHIIVTSQAFDPLEVDVLELSRYTGVLRETKFSNTDVELSGAGLVFHLGDLDAYKVIKTEINLDSEGFEDGINLILPPSIEPGDIVAEIGAESARYLYVTYRSALEDWLSLFGAEFYVTPQGRLNAGTPASLFPSYNNPTTFVIRKGAGADINLKPLPLASLVLNGDATNYATEVISLVQVEDESFIEGGATGTTAKRDLHGNLLDIAIINNETTTIAQNVDSRAAARLAQAQEPRTSVELSTEDYDIHGDFRPGDSIWVYDKPSGVHDLTNEIEFRGQTYWPIKLRVLEISYPVVKGMGVYFKDPISGDIHDLTPYVVWEPAGTSQIEVSTFTRSLLPPSSGGIGGVIAPVVNPGAPPGIPDPPSVFGDERTLFVVVPTTTAGQPQPLNVTSMRVYASTTSGFTPGPTNYIGVIPVSKANITLGQNVREAFDWFIPDVTYVRVTAVNTQEGPASIEVSDAATLIPSAAILSLVADKIDAGTISASIEMTAAIMTGGLLRSAFSGNRIEIAGSDPDLVSMYTGETGELNPGYFQVFNSSIDWTSPEFVAGQFANIRLTGQGGPEALARPRIHIGGAPANPDSPDIYLLANEIGVATTSSILLDATTSITVDATTSLSLLAGTAIGIGATGGAVTVFASTNVNLTATADFALNFGDGYIAANGTAIDLNHDLGGRFYADDIAEIGALGSTQMWIDGGEAGIVGSSAFEFEVIGVGVKRLRIGVADSGGAGKRLVFVDN